VRTSLMASVLMGSVAFLAVASPAAAQDASQTGDHHDQPASEIVVTAIYARNQNDVLAGTSVLSAEELTRDLKPTLGETLSKQAGVSATSFGPNASRPVLRGFQGERVRVLSDGIGSFDVSNTSVDHAVAINPLTADRIEVLRGPSALLFGTSAIGGVVNVIDARIPRRMPGEAIHVDGIATYGSAATERSISSAVDVPLGTKFVAHVDMGYSKTADQRISGFILTPALRNAAALSVDPDVRALANLQGKLANSGARTWTVAGGGAVITDTGNLGFSVTHYDSLYGVPVRYSIDPDIVAESVRLDVKQTRLDLRAEVNVADGFLEAIRFRGGFADYTHNEIDQTGAIGTTFNNQGWEGRLELVQRENNGWKGAIGGQFFVRELDIIGAEKFLPRSDTAQIGLFTVQSFDLGVFRGEIGGRYEHSKLEAQADALLGSTAQARMFDAVSGSMGGSIEVLTGWRIGLNASYTQRAPSAEELFSNGPHAGTQAFEIGDANFAKEVSTGLEATLRGKGRGYTLSASAYYSRFKNFIYELPTGRVVDGLPVFQFQQDRAEHYGAEIDASVKLFEMGGFDVNFDTVADFTRARIKGGGPIPRIPALRVLGGLEARSDALDVRGEVEWVDNQNRISSFETPTKGYTMVNASLAWRPFADAKSASITVSANNLFDVKARRHASFLKDYAPLSGRDIRVSLRTSF
jgi:iron complex outermembrane recepter protein